MLASQLTPRIPQSAGGHRVKESLDDATFANILSKTLSVLGPGAVSPKSTAGSGMHRRAGSRGGPSQQDISGQTTNMEACTEKPKRSVSGETLPCIQ